MNIILCDVQASEAYKKSDAVGNKAPPMLHALRNAFADDESYNKAKSLLMDMLHPDISSRAKVQQALASPLFA